LIDENYYAGIGRYFTTPDSGEELVQIAMFIDRFLEIGNNQRLFIIAENYLEYRQSARVKKHECKNAI